MYVLLNNGYVLLLLYLMLECLVFSEIGSLKFDTRDRAIRCGPHSERCSTNNGGCHETDHIWHVGPASI